MQRLEAAGVDAAEERVYRLLVSSFDGDPAAVATRLGFGPDQATGLLESLRAKGLVSLVPGSPVRYVPNPPDVAFGPMLLRGQESLEWARTAISQLAEEYRVGVRRRDAGQLVEVVTGAAAIRQQIANMQRSARREIAWFCKAGHVATTSHENAEEEYEALTSGVRYRVLYEQALLEEPGMIANVAEGIRKGEEARATTTLPVRLAIADSSIGLCPLVPAADGQGEPTAALIRDSSLLAAFRALFESYWERASPIRLTEPADATGDPALTDPAGEPTLADDERYLLSLLIGGVTDKAIASQLGISQRTVQRRVYELMRRAEAETRMQLAWRVSRLGWLDD